MLVCPGACLAPGAPLSLRLRLAVLPRTSASPSSCFSTPARVEANPLFRAMFGSSSFGSGRPALSAGNSLNSGLVQLGSVMELWKSSKFMVGTKSKLAGLPLLK